MSTPTTLRGSRWSPKHIASAVFKALAVQVSTPQMTPFATGGLFSPHVHDPSPSHRRLSRPTFPSQDPHPAKQSDLSCADARELAGGFASHAPSTDCCSVCMEDVVDDMAFLPCGHYFHVECVACWFARIQECPNCRSEVKPSA